MPKVDYKTLTDSEKEQISQKMATIRREEKSKDTPPSQRQPNAQAFAMAMDMVLGEKSK